MINWFRTGLSRSPRSWPTSLLVSACLSAVTIGTAHGMVSDGRARVTELRSRLADGDRARFDAYLLTLEGAAGRERATLAAHAKSAIPAFARKYGLPCSACHTVWPELNNFGQVFRDNGYQLRNERDSPIDVAPSYWPASFRTTPHWHMERTDHQLVDAIPGDSASGLVERTITSHGFDLSGFDLLTFGTLYKDISFGFTPSADNTGAFHIEAAFVRFDNLLHSTWANFQLGKFEIDNLISEKRALTLSNNGGFYQSYHFVPPGDVTSFGIGDNQLGIQLLGHSTNSYTRYAVALFGSTDGEVGLTTGRGYDGAVTLSQAFELGSLGLQRIGVYGYLGQRPTQFETVAGVPVAGTGMNEKKFYRVGAAGDFFLGDLELQPFYLHGYDDAFLATGTPAGQPLPDDARNAQWNAGFLELHYYVNPQLVFIQRTELVRMSQQALPTTPSDLGNVDALTFGCRWYPIMFSRAGLAMHAEYSLSNTRGTVPLSGDGVGLPPLFPGTKVRSSSLFLALDFAF